MILITYFILDLIRKFWSNVIIMPIVYVIAWFIIAYISYKIGMEIFKAE